MKQTIFSILIFFGAVFVGAQVNMAIIMGGSSVIPPPAGVDPSNIDSIAENMHLYGFTHFMVPFLAHALGTLVGAFLVAKFAPLYKLQLALAVGFIFLLGGIAMVMMLPSPLWFNVLDVGVAYLPMGYLGWWLNAAKIEPEN